MVNQIVVRKCHAQLRLPINNLIASAIKVGQTGIKNCHDTAFCDEELKLEQLWKRP